MTGARFAGEPAGVPAALVSSEPGSVAAKARDENFPVALRLLPSARRRYLMAVYVFARTVDDIGDRAQVASRLGLLAEVEADLRALYDSLGAGRAGGEGESSTRNAGKAKFAAVRGLQDTVADCAIPIQPFLDLIAANRQDQVVHRYRTIDELYDYCRLSANPVGRIVLHVFNEFSVQNAELSDSICTGLQLAEHWQDVAEDYLAGRIYLPEQDMDRFGCTAGQLAEPHAPAQLKKLLEFEADRASDLLDAGAPLVGRLAGTARMAVAGYLAGGRAALAAIKAAEFDVLAATPRPGRARTLAELILALLRGR